MSNANYVNIFRKKNAKVNVNLFRMLRGHTDCDDRKDI